jgi:hypothetical protein
MNIPFKIFLLLLAFGLSACGGGGGGGDDDPSGGSNDGTTGGSTGGGISATDVEFRLTGALALVANEDAVVEAARAARGSNGQELFTYQLAKNVAGRQSARDRVTNLLAIQEDGTTRLAIDSELPIRALYTAINPAGTHVYIALDNGWYNFDGTDTNDYSQFIAANNCALYVVSLSDDSFSCVQEGLYVQDYNDGYYQTMSDNSKPVQFDAAGNAYFLATTFTVEGDDFGYCDGGDWSQLSEENGFSPDLYDDNGNWLGCTEEAIAAGFQEVLNFWINSTSWQPRLYKFAHEDGTATALSQDNEYVEYFTVLASGDVAVKGWSDNFGSGSSTFDLFTTTGGRVAMNQNEWGIEFFTSDGTNTILFSEWSNDGGIRLVTPAGGGGIYKTTLGLSGFAQNQGGSYTNPTPRRLIVADDGHLYGVFESWNGYYDANDVWVDENTLTIYSVLPYDPVPKAKIVLGSNGWWNYMEGAPFQISRGLLFYRNPSQNVQIGGASFGTADAITMVNLQTRETKTILFPVLVTDPRYRIYNWRLSGTNLYFSALEQSSNTVVTGTVDTVALRGVADAGNLGSGGTATYLEITENASAAGAASAIQDIEVLQPLRPATDPGNTPRVSEIYMHSENLNSASIEFSKYMDTESVLGGISFLDDDSGDPVTYLPVWTYQTLHLIPDLSLGALGDDVSMGLQAGTNYSLTVASNVYDFYSVQIDSSDPADLTKSITTRPDSGWYLGSTDSADTALTSGQVAKFAGRADNNWDWDYYNIMYNVPPDFRLEFSTRNLRWDLIGITLHDSSEISEYNFLLNVDISSWNAWANYTVDNTSYSWFLQEWVDYYDDDSNGIANGNWIRVRMDVFANTYRLSVSEDGVTYTVLHEVTDIVARGSEELYISVVEPILLDNVQVSTLDGSGDLVAVAGDVLDEDFDGDVTTIGDVDMQFDLVNATTDTVADLY